MIKREHIRDFFERTLKIELFYKTVFTRNELCSLWNYYATHHGLAGLSFEGHSRGDSDVEKRIELINSICNYLGDSILPMHNEQYHLGMMFFLDPCDEVAWSKAMHSIYHEESWNE